MLEVDEMGLEPQDRRLFLTIIEKFNGGPVGANTLAAALSEDRGVIEDIYEPYLMMLGFLQRSSSGRVALPCGISASEDKRKRRAAMSIRAVLLDADGVAIKPHPYFSQRLEDDFGISAEKILIFFRGEFKNCTLGKADLKDEISAKYLPAWGLERFSK